MTIESPPLWVQGGTYPARLDRFSLDVMFEEGVLSPIDCKVVQRAAGANFSVDISVGSFIIQGDDQPLQGKYLGRVTAAENVTIGAAPGSNSRYDLLTLRVNDPNAGGNAGNTVTAVVVAGTVSATPSVPALPASSIPIAVIGPITPSTSSITTSLIGDAFNTIGPTYARSCRMLAGEKSPVGQMIMMAANATAVNGWLYCDGSAVSRATYAGLFAVLGTSFGAGDGSTTFNLPNLQDRVPIARGSTFAAPGAVGGEIAHQLSVAELPSHNHTGLTSNENQFHTHTGTTNGESGHTHGDQAGGNALYQDNAVGTGNYQSVNDTGGRLLYTGRTGPGSGHTHTFTSGSQSIFHQHVVFNQGGDGSHNNVQPYQVVAGWMIKF